MNDKHETLVRFGFLFFFFLIGFVKDPTNLIDLHVSQDVGCGVGGPLREIVRLSGARVTGINNNAYQIERCKAYSKKLGIESKTYFIKVNYEKRNTIFLHFKFQVNFNYLFIGGLHRYST